MCQAVINGYNQWSTADLDNSAMGVESQLCYVNYIIFSFSLLFVLI